MASLARRIALALFLGGFAAFCSADSTAADANVPDCETIMKKCNSKKGLTSQIKAAVKDEKWEDAQKAAKELKEFGAALGKNTANKGEKTSWEKLTKKFAEQTSAIADATDKKDSAAYDKAAKAYGGSCKACHDSHK
jgi:cytochrome c556